MSSTATSGAAVVSPAERVEVLFEELAELAGQRNAIDGRIVEIVAELDRDGLWGVTGARSVAGLVAWKMGCSSGNAHTIATVARRLPEFPRCAGVGRVRARPPPPPRRTDSAPWWGPTSVPPTIGSGAGEPMPRCWRRPCV
ncbi:DUF222 domain-containing protein, partial [Mycobacterium tuberculosis]|uniref:DUF222 domain-containing protein n=1 Tax=Mycobacterium tuberculosis TaxID=1773 RepID=UPI0034CEEBBD